MFDSKKVDSISEPSNESFSVKAPSSKKGAPKKTTPKVPSDLAPTDLVSEEFTIDPITGEKYRVSTGNQSYLGKRNFRIPTINRPGFVTMWAVNRGNEIQNRLDEGWRFVDPNTLDCDAAVQMPHAGYNPRGDKMVHRAMQMPIEKYKELMAARDRANDQREQDIIFNPKSLVQSGDQKDFKVWRENSLGQKKEHGRSDV